MAPVVFSVVSPQFFFKAGRAVLFRLTTGPPPTLTTIAGGSYDATDLGLANVQLEEITIRDGETSPAAIRATGSFQAVLAQLTLIRSSDGRQFEVAGTLAETEVTFDDVRSGRATLTVDAPVVLTMRVQDSAGQPVANATVSTCVSTRAGSWEHLTNEKGEVVCLGISGHYHVVAQSPDYERCRTNFQITDDDTGERVVVMTLANSASS